MIFTKNNVLPSVKILTFTRSEAFELTAEYTADSGLRPEQLHIGKFQITDIPKTRDGGPAKIKVKIGLNLAGLIYVESATMHDEYEVEELVPVKVDPKPAAPAEKKEEPAAAADAEAADGTAKMDTDAPPADAEAPAKMDTDTPAEAEKAPEKPAEPQMEKVKKKKITRADLKVVAQVCNGSTAAACLGPFPNRAALLAPRARSERRATLRSLAQRPALRLPACVCASACCVRVRACV